MKARYGLKLLGEQPMASRNPAWAVAWEFVSDSMAGLTDGG